MTPRLTDEPTGKTIPSPSGSAPPDGHPGSGDLGRQALLAFWRDLPRLLQEHPRQWVAYHGERQLGFASTRAELWAECLRQGLQPEEFLIRSIEPEDADIVLE
jgi:hypothetical protein